MGSVEIFGPSAVNVTFASASGAIVKLDDSQAYTGTVQGLSPPGQGAFAVGPQLDLADIAFCSQTMLGYAPNGANTGGTLTAPTGPTAPILPSSEAISPHRS